MAKRLPGPSPRLAGYSYVRPLGTGGFADVFMYEQEMPRRVVAVKVLLSAGVDAEVVRMFNAEADAMAKLSAHPSILTVYEASIAPDGRPYLVMEYCPRSLEGYRTLHLSVAETLRIGVKISCALETAHRSRMLHRDIKPSNILFTAYNTPVLSDFGIATAIGPQRREGRTAMSVPWSAPEIVSEESTGSVATEVWSLGATLYSLLAGRSPFETGGHESRDRLVARIRRARYTPVDRVDVPAQLQDLLHRTLSAAPERRPGSALEVAQGLQGVETALGLPPTPLEVVAEEWAQAGLRVTFDDEHVRGVRRSTVGYVARRPAAAPGEGDADAAPTGSPHLRRVWVALALGAAVLAGVLVWLIAVR